MAHGKQISKATARRLHKRTHCADCDKLVTDGTLEEFFYPGEHWNYEEDPRNSAGLLCFDCSSQCWCHYCRLFRAGSEDFDFSPQKGYCRSCWEEIKSDFGEDDYDPDLDFGFDDYEDDDDL